MIITVIKAEIDADAGWAVGAADAGALGLDRELLTDPEGRPWVPPSSLAGSLRAHLATHDCDERLMGSRPAGGAQQASGQPARLTASALWLLGTRARRKGDARASGAEADRPPGTAVVANTAVDPERQAAVPKSLRHSRVVDGPAVIELYAMLEGELPAADQDLLASWQPQIGRDRTRGGGTARLASLGYRTYRLDQPEDLRDWLEAAGPGRFGPLTSIPVRGMQDPIVLQAEFRITAALRVGTGSRRGKVAVLRARDGQPLLPATTWKGLFRARAGYILRSCWGEDAACISQSGCPRCRLCDLFGSTVRRGRISFRDSTITARPGPRTHVAIDRISGGGQDKLLFTDDVVTSGTVRLTIGGLGPVAEWERQLLIHVIRDVHEGLIGVGGGSQRGQGTLRLADAPLSVLAGLSPMPTEPPFPETAP
jgi:CRISPR/Cas system CSM-associated protein Csm3 (group 7 of RAMP superfamily)